MKKTKTLVLGCYLLSLLVLAGCATTYGERSDMPLDASLEVAGVLRFDDVPVPFGFSVLEKDSFTFQNDVTRVALLKYSGGKNADLVVEFYKENMPLYNWNPINIIEYERRILNYEKEAESCIVTVESKGRKTLVVIAISPKSRPMKVEVEKKSKK